MTKPSAETVDSMGSYRTLGRLLAVGMGAGAFIGGTVTALTVHAAGGGGGGWVGAMSIGITLGILAGLVAQVITHVTVLIARRTAHPVRASRLCATTIPVIPACAL